MFFEVGSKLKKVFGFVDKIYKKKKRVQELPLHLSLILFVFSSSHLFLLSSPSSLISLLSLFYYLFLTFFSYHSSTLFISSFPTSLPTLLSLFPSSLSTFSSNISSLASCFLRCGRDEVMNLVRALSILLKRVMHHCILVSKFGTVVGRHLYVLGTQVSPHPLLDAPDLNEGEGMVVIIPSTANLPLLKY